LSPETAEAIGLDHQASSPASRPQKLVTLTNGPKLRNMFGIRSHVPASLLPTKA
jgi:hypothetical protein